MQEIPPREARYAEPTCEIPEDLQSVLRRNNIHRLYTHQAAALDAISDGKDVVIVTATASGKTLCYNLPIVRALMKDPGARALCLYPTKALTQDQHGTLMRWAGEDELKDVLKPAVYDGDTPSHNRTKIRSNASVVLTNPDMLHVGVLPYHGKWHSFLRSLKYIVVDEVHTYRGIFGSHVAGVLRRLMRLCEHYGSRPQVICSSATIANPVRHAGELTGRDMTLIDNDGAPRGRKYFALWNPPFLADDQVSRRSANIEAVEILKELVTRRAQTIVFTKSRIAAELIYKYARDELKGTDDLANRIRPYRGGYLPNERREIEQQLFSGKLLAVSATNALELGIDVGNLDAAVLVGFPGTICSTWQQAGRAGRTSQDSLVFLVGYNEPVDQYLMRHPEYLFGATHEHAVIDPANPHILAGQLSCACFEKPLAEGDADFFGPLVDRVARIFAEDGEMKEIDGKYYWSTSEYPAKRVNLRTISPDTYAITDIKNHKAIGNVDSISAPELVYPGAVYLHEAESYLVRELDNEGKVAYVEPADVDYYTQPVLANSARFYDPVETNEFLDGELFFGPADVTWQTTAFKKIKYYTMEVLGQSELDLPSQTLATTGMWWAPSGAMMGDLKQAGYNPVEALCGVRNLGMAALPQLAMCDRKDISGMVDSRNLGRHVIFMYDRYAGGLGFAQRGFELFGEWMQMCYQLVKECPCESGCPSCVGLPFLRPPIHHDPDLGGGYPVPDKAGT
ncbi:MAG: DEAD/DEAH box helicase, partial [Phycisphaerae bacterium]